MIGLFIEEKIPRGLTPAGDGRRDPRQGGLVYVPHPFDRMHTVPGYEHLLQILEEIDAIEVFNPRVAIAEFNEEAARFAAKYRMTAGAGSDAHVAAGLGSVRIRMRDFDGPEEFLESLRDADIPQAGEPALRPGAEVPRNQGDARGGAPGAPGAPRAARDAQVLMHAQGQHAAPRKSDPAECPRPTTRSARSTSSARSAN